MGGKIRSILLLIMTLVMIYFQYSPISYAEDMGNAWHTREWESGDNNVEETENGEESGEKDGEDNQDKEDEKDEGDGEDEGDKKDEGDGEDEGDKKDEGDGEDEGGKKDDEDKKDDNGNEESDGKDKEPVRKYELALPKANGKNGYYITAPEIVIKHASFRGKTVYMLKNGNRITEKGELKKKGEHAVLPGERLEEGRNILSVYMEDEEGVRIEDFNLTKEILLDTKKPSIQVVSSDGFDVWYQKEARISVSANDGTAGSQIDSIVCYCGGELVGAVRDSEGSFLIDRASRRAEGADVLIIVNDQAGNKSEWQHKFYIDEAAPRILVEGAEDYMITSQAAELVFRISDDNGLKSCNAKIGWENPDGERLLLSEPEWTGDAFEKETALSLEKDGIYYMRIAAEDLSGYSEERVLQLIIDRHNPVIRYVDTLEGKYMKRFRWDYQKEAFIQDFTTYDYQIQLDGKLYPIGKEIREEGRHMLKVQVVDSAGNKAEANASFVVDHTPPEIVFSELEEGAVYEEERTFQIAVKGTEDELKGVRINGVFQPLTQGGRSRQYTLREKGEYVVIVRACDKAGNETISGIRFKIAEKETVLQKVIKPIRRMFSGEKEEYTEKRRVKEASGSYEEKQKGLLTAEAICTVCTALCAVGIVLYRRKRKS